MPALVILETTSGRRRGEEASERARSRLALVFNSRRSLARRLRRLERVLAISLGDSLRSAGFILFFDFAGDLGDLVGGEDPRVFARGGRQSPSTTVTSWRSVGGDGPRSTIVVF